MLGFLLRSSWVWKIEEERVSAKYRQKHKNCLFCGASAHLFPVAAAIGTVRCCEMSQVCISSNLSRGRFKLFLWQEHQRCLVLNAPASDQKWARAAQTPPSDSELVQCLSFTWLPVSVTFIGI